MPKVRAALLAALAVLAGCCAASACGYEPYDLAEEMRLLKATSRRADLAPAQRAEFDAIMAKIDVPTDRFGYSGLSAHADLRGQALALVSIDRVPRWPYQMEDALTKHDGSVARAALARASDDWKAGRYDAAVKGLAAAVKQLDIHIFYPRC